MNHVHGNETKTQDAANSLLNGGGHCYVAGTKVFQEYKQ